MSDDELGSSETVTGEEPQQTEESPQADNSEDQLSEQPADNTADDSEIQAQEPDQKPADIKEEFYKKVSEHLSEKEKLMLAYVNNEIPSAYYEAWRAEANAVFGLLVRLRDRFNKSPGRSV